jgi:probable HAF family extracellular repeat protein
MAPWWSAGLPQRRRVSACLSLDGVWGDARPRHAGRLLERGLWVFPPTAPWWSAGLKRRRVVRAFRWTAAGGMQNLGTLGGSTRAGLMVFPPTAPWWSAGLTTPQGRSCLSLDGVGGMQDLGTLGGDRSVAYGVSADGSVVVGEALNAAGQGVPFAGRMVSCKTSARWAAIGARLMGVSADGSVVVGWADNAAGQRRAFRWTASGGMEDLNTTYASLLTNGSVL